MDCIPDNPLVSYADTALGAYPISANFICLCFSVLSLFVSYLSCSFCNSSVYQKVCFIRSCQRGRDGKGKGNPPSLFCVFGSFCHSTKGTSFSLSFGKGAVSFLLTEAGGTMVLFLSAGKVPKSAFSRIATRSVGAKLQSSFAIAFVSCRLKVCLWTASLQCCCSPCNVLLCRSTLRKVCADFAYLPPQRELFSFLQTAFVPILRR